MQQSITFSSGTVNYHFPEVGENPLDTVSGVHNAVFITDEHIAALYPQLFEGRKCIVLPAGEHSKDMATIIDCANQLPELGATRTTLLVGVGGGVVTDITGLLASVYMRGVPFGFIPTTLLGMVDAAIGGKNGVNMGLVKNIIGTIKQPQFIIFDAAMLHTLPGQEWSNGFAEIIKYACIFDAQLFDELAGKNLADYMGADTKAIANIIQRCVAWKNKTVLEDEREQGMRKLLNFGHTAAHAIENLYELSHGKAVAIGMVVACTLSEQETGLPPAVTAALKRVLAQYELPLRLDIDVAKVMEVLKMDKKRKNDTIYYILLEHIGRAVIKALPFPVIEHALTNL